MSRRLFYYKNAKPTVEMNHESSSFGKFFFYKTWNISSKEGWFFVWEI